MNRLVWRRFLPLIMVLLLAPSLPGAASATTTSGAAIVDCGSKPRVRPATLIIACADANRYVSDIRWSNWGRATSSGHGFLYWNDCAPTCVAGHFHRRPLVFSATSLKSRHGRLVYTRLYAAPGTWGDSSRWWVLSY